MSTSEPTPPGPARTEATRRGPWPEVDIGGLDRHFACVVYPRGFRTWKNASLFTPDGRMVWFGDLGRHMVHTHLRGKGTFYVLSEGDVWPSARRYEIFAAEVVERFWASPSYVERKAIAKIVNGRWFWLAQFNEAAYKNRRRNEERNAQRARRRKGLPRLNCCQPDGLPPADLSALLTVTTFLHEAGENVASLYTTRLRFGGRDLQVDDEELPRIRALAKACELARTKFPGISPRELLHRHSAPLGGQTMWELIHLCQEHRLHAAVEGSIEWTAVH